MILERKPEIVLVGATSIGRNIGPRVAARVGTGLVADCTGLAIDETDGKILQTRPAFGGNLMATIICPKNRPQMSTVRPGVMAKAAHLDKPSCSVETVKPNLTEDDITVELLEVVKSGKKTVNLIKLSQPGEIVGLLLPNAAPTMGLILALSIGRRVPALLNYTAGADGMRSACVAAGIKTIIASRNFVEKARLTATVAQLGDLNEHYEALLRVETVNFSDPESSRRRPMFAHLTPIFPNVRINLDSGPGDWATCLVDMFAPIGLGQRALIVSPLKTNKTAVE